MALSFEVEARRPAGRPKKVWRKLVEENMILSITEEMAMDRPHILSNPMTVKNGTLNHDNDDQLVQC